MILPLVALVAMWFFLSRSQKKQQQERQSLLDSMSVGSDVVTIGGLHGVISEINTEKSTITLDCEGIFLEFDRSAIRTVKPGTVVANDDAVTEVEVKDIEQTTETSDENSETKE
ncbi:preprotein translocase, YajC subunit [Enterococcus canis]|uniref:Preprotein translocase, YajC subunit n=1 Tax=Enterococcus canis TaxID=214095 RepID=A0A1L8REY2_9ENTE|nr:preprotein translocase subunit YajC [Enterococcus canis]OJG18336.1 preprotein translocase, YajC subunit [Enterococcus canis]